MTTQTITRTKKPTTNPGTDRKPRWLSYPEAAEMCTLSVRSLKRLTAAGKLPCYVIGGKVLRLKSSDGKIHGPGTFIPAAERRLAAE